MSGPDRESESSTAHVGVTIEATVGEVYDYVADPTTLPLWATGLSGSIAQQNGVWVADSPMGRIVVEFAERNQFGVLDHIVTTEDGARFCNPLRVVEHGGGCEIVFSLRRAPGMDDDAFESDRATVLADLTRLKGIIEG